jgi:hypothetical protein
MGSHCQFGHLKHKSWSKEKSRVKLAIWLPTIKSKKSTQFPCVKAVCDISLKSFRWRLQFCFRFHYNQRSTCKVMRPQSRGSPSCENFRTPTWEFGTKSHLDVAPVERCRIYYKGEGGGFPQVWAVVSLVSPNYPWFVLAPKVLQLCTNHLVLILYRFV